MGLRDHLPPPGASLQQGLRPGQGRGAPAQRAPLSSKGVTPALTLVSQAASGRRPLSRGIAPYTSTLLIGKVMILFHFIFRKKSPSAGCRGQLECVGRGTLFFPRRFGNQADGWPLDYIRGHGWCFPAVGHVTTLAVGRGENFPSACRFPSVLSFRQSCSGLQKGHLPPSL